MKEETKELIEGIRKVEKQKEEHKKNGDYSAVFSCDLTLQILNDELVKKTLELIENQESD